MSIPRIAWAAYGFALVVVIMDQITKAMILGSVDVPDANMIPPGYLFAEIIPGVLSFTMVRNTGVSFGLFGGGEARWFLSAFSIVVAGALAWWAMKAERRLLVTAIGLVIGGAIGNVIDRVRFGYVVDFIDFSATGLFPWVFNVADSAITVGVALLILDSVISERKPAVGAAPEKA
ncbi:signal peptidase II [Brevundimonas sp. AAP58]|uniref:signal peptidase II n=1 Tax=Brevundimonas sp. AAP58 TaxID=1523422 RepID=UPI0006B935C3|nr:signal peptidase II [Brevundimonas sp. AAP58]KPF81381.1 signal peptidase II [Brevundimonas sp. AAP58]